MANDQQRELRKRPERDVFVEPTLRQRKARKVSTKVPKVPEKIEPKVPKFTLGKMRKLPKIKNRIKKIV